MNNPPSLAEEIGEPWPLRFRLYPIIQCCTRVGVETSPLSDSIYSKETEIEALAMNYVDFP